ncbi:MAG: hypothetical protein IKO23_09385 [Bacteroidales bacterium]|nr:hypothetical protein [Bacteroidales bacterium]
MKTHIIKFGDGCTLIVTLIDRNGQVIRPSVLKTLAVSLARGATTASNIGFTLNANGTITIGLTRSSHLTAVGTYNLILVGALADGQSFSNNDQIIEVKSLTVSNPTTFNTSIILRQVHAVDETNYPLGFDGLGFEAFDATMSYKTNEVVIFNGRLYKFNVDHAAGIWKDSQVEETDIQTLLFSGVLVAGDIMPKSDAPIEVVGRFAAQTTGGDADIKNGTAYLRVIKGNLDDSLNPFNAKLFVSTSMNLVDENQYISGNGVKAFYFPVVAGAFGTYGTTQENNGFIIVGDSHVENVFFNRERPARIEDLVEDCPYEDHEGKRYCLPPTAGWLTILVRDGEPVPACHIAWSNYNDENAGSFENFDINVTEAIAAVHSWGLAGFVTPAKTVQDVVDLANGKGYAYCDRALLKNLTWSMQTVTTTDEEEHTTTVYVFTATVTGMADNGLCAYRFEGLENNGNLLTYSSETINSVNNLKAALDEALIYYEKATPSEVTLPDVQTEFKANDFGLTYFMLDEELVSVPAYVTTAFHQGGKDQLFNAVSYQKLMAEVVATALCQFDKRLSAVEGRRDVSCSSLTVSRKFDMPRWRHVDAQPAAATSPGRIGDYFITSTYFYLCVETNTWKKIAISNF